MERAAPSQPGRLLRDAFDRAALEYAPVTLDFRFFARKAVRRAYRRSAADSALRRAKLVDLYLAIACDRGDPVAWRVLQETVMPRVARSLVWRGLPRAWRRSVPEELVGLLVARAPGPGGRGALRAYAGRSTIESWLRAVALNVGRQRLRHRSRRRSVLRELFRRATRIGAHPVARLSVGPRLVVFLWGGAQPPSLLHGPRARPGDTRRSPRELQPGRAAGRLSSPRLPGGPLGTAREPTEASRRPHARDDMS
jgi:hypothetical protein